MSKLDKFGRAPKLYTKEQVQTTISLLEKKHPGLAAMLVGGHDPGHVAFLYKVPIAKVEKWKEIVLYSRRKAISNFLRKNGRPRGETGRLPDDLLRMASTLVLRVGVSFEWDDHPKAAELLYMSAILREIAATFDGVWNPNSMEGRQPMVGGKGDPLSRAIHKEMVERKRGCEPVDPDGPKGGRPKVVKVEEPVVLPPQPEPPPRKPGRKTREKVEGEATEKAKRKVKRATRVKRVPKATKTKGGA